jgi:hypothetical protein
LKERKGSPLETMKKLYRENKLTFKKTEFAHKFFSQFEYKKSINETVQRLVNFADAIFNDAIEK